MIDCGWIFIGFLVGAFYWGKTKVGYITSKKILQSKQIPFCDFRPEMLFAAFKPFTGKYSIQYANGIEWEKRYKAIYSNVFIRDLKGKISIIKGVMDQICSEWDKLFNEQKNDNEPFVIKSNDIGFKFAGKATIYTAFTPNMSDITLNKIIEEYYVAWGLMEKQLIEGKALSDEEQNQFKTSHNELKTIVYDLIQNSSHQSTLVKAMKNCEYYSTKERMFDEAITAIAGGLHTTGHSIEWLLYYISIYPNIQDKMYKEIMNEYSYESFWDLFTNKNKLRYCKNVIHEVLRISSIAPWSARYNNIIYRFYIINICIIIMYF